MPRELRLVVDRDREEPQPPPVVAVEPAALAIGITILGITLVAVGMIAWVNSEAFTRAAWMNPQK